MSKVRYKYCVVPGCKSTTTKTPDKLFFSIPTGELRSEWCAVMGRAPPEYKPLSAKCNRFCCEDHFNLENDMENYMQWKLMGSKKLIIKKGVLPHKFHCRSAQPAAGDPAEPSKPEETMEDVLNQSLLYRNEGAKEKLKSVIKKKKKTPRKTPRKQKPHQTAGPADDDGQKASPTAEERDEILQQMKKIAKITQVTRDKEESVQQHSELEHYTFQVKVEADEESELSGEIIEEYVFQDYTAPDRNRQELQVAVKVEELDEEFEPVLMEAQPSAPAATVNLAEANDDNFDTLLLVRDFVTEDRDAH